MILYLLYPTSKNHFNLLEKENMKSHNYNPINPIRFVLYKAYETAPQITQIGFLAHHRRCHVVFCGHCDLAQYNFARTSFRRYI